MNPAQAGIILRSRFAPTLRTWLQQSPSALMDLCECTGFTIDFIADIASGDRQPNRAELEELCAVLDLNPDAFLSVEGDA